MAKKKRKARRKKGVIQTALQKARAFKAKQIKRFLSQKATEASRVAAAHKREAMRAEKVAKALRKKAKKVKP